MVMKSKIYADVADSTSATSKTGLVYDFEAVNNSIRNFFLTPSQGSRLFEPTVYSGLEDHIFDLIDEDTALSIMAVFSRLEYLDKRIKIIFNECSVTPYPEEHRYEVLIYYTLDGLSNEVFEYRGDLARNVTY